MSSSITIEEMVANAIRKARQTFLSGKTLSLEFRKSQLKGLLALINENEDLLVNCLARDFGKPRYEAIMTDTDFVRNDALGMIHNIDLYTRRNHVSKTLVTAFDQSFTRFEPLGVVLVIGTWNYPVQVLLSPLVGAIAAGNTVILKPSELAPLTASTIQSLLPKYLDPDSYFILTGGPDVCQEILRHKLDFIFYTGSASIGRKIHQAAAAHLTPVCLELGGKSPCYIHNDLSDTELTIALKRIFWGKLVNAGQTCVATDYILCNEQVKDLLLKKVGKILKGFLSNSSNDMTRIISEKHYKRLKLLISSTGGKVHSGEEIGVYDEENETDRYFPLKIVTDLDPEKDPLMAEEIFGPILPIVQVRDVDHAISFITGRGQKPLTMYIFANDSVTIDKLVEKTSSGSICVNDTVMQMIHDSLPFGGVGDSGFGSYHGFHSFKCFSHEKSVMIRGYNPILEWVASKRYPPYSDNHLKRMLRLLRKRRIMSQATMEMLPLRGSIGFLIGILYGYIFYTIFA